MGTRQTARNRIDMVRNSVIIASRKGLKVVRKKLEAQIILTGSTKRHARETVQTFIDADEFKQEEEFGEKVLSYNFQPEELELMKKEADELMDKIL